MSFNPDPSKQEHEDVFSRKIKQRSYPPVRLNNKSVKEPLFQKNVGVYLQSKLNFCALL